MQIKGERLNLFGEKGELEARSRVTMIKEIKIERNELTVVLHLDWLPSR